MSEQNQIQAPTPAVPPPANTTGDNGVRTYTEDEVKERLRGQGKELERLKAQVEAQQQAEAQRQAEAEAAERDRLAKQGEFKTLAEQAATERDEYKTRYEALAKAETKRLEGMAAANKTRLEALPEHLQALVPPGLDAYAAAEQISKIEALNGVQSPATVHGGPPRGGTPLDPEAVKKDRARKAREFVFGKEGSR